MHITPRRLVLISVLAFMGLVVAGFVLVRRAPGGWVSASPALQAIMWPAARTVADFELFDQQGESFDADALLGKWNLLYFGYLQCPDICPTTLQSLRVMRTLMAESEPDAAIPRIIFVSIDPENDNSERIGRYLAFFGDDPIGLSGAPAQLAILAQSLGVMYAEYRDPSGVRSMDHTTSIIVVDPQGRGVAALPAPHQPSVMIQQLKELREHLRQ